MSIDRPEACGRRARLVGAPTGRYRADRWPADDGAVQSQPRSARNRAQRGSDQETGRTVSRSWRTRAGSVCLVADQFEERVMNNPERIATDEVLYSVTD